LNTRARPEVLAGSFFSSAPFARHLLALLARLRQADRDGLLAAFDLAAFAAASALRGSALIAPHLAFDVFSRAA